MITFTGNDNWKKKSAVYKKFEQSFFHIVIFLILFKGLYDLFVHKNIVIKCQEKEEKKRKKKEGNITFKRILIQVFTAILLNSHYTFFPINIILIKSSFLTSIRICKQRIQYLLIPSTIYLQLLCFNIHVNNILI